MNQQEIFVLVKEIFNRLVTDKIEVTILTSSREVSRWDSLTHVMFIAEIEKTFGIRFDIFEMLEMRNIGDICTNVERLVKAK